MKNSIAGLVLLAGASLAGQGCGSFPGSHEESDVAAKIGTKTITIQELDE